MSTENVNMDIENTTTTTSASAQATVGDSSNGVRLTSEMLSKVNVSVNMKFLADIRNVLDLATQRGTWRANELTAVGSLVDSLDNAFKQLASKSGEVVAAASASGSEDSTETADVSSADTSSNSVSQ